MASPTPFSIDDQEERHFIGDLLSEEDVFEQSDGTHIDGPATSHLLTGGGVLSSSGPPIPSPSQTCRREPLPFCSGYTVSPPQWSPVNNQSLTSFIASPVATAFGPSQTATAITPTYFLEAAVNGPGEWRPFTRTSLDGFRQMSSEILYPRHTGIHVSITPASDATDMVHHYYGSVDHRHLHCCVVNTSSFTRPSDVMRRAAVSSMIERHAGMDRNLVLHAPTVHTERSTERILVREQSSGPAPDDEFLLDQGQTPPSSTGSLGSSEKRPQYGLHLPSIGAEWNSAINSAV
uniref:ORF2 n=1 Tax=Ascaris lumbricoides TaxID=6252 RepID=A0A0M3HT75_ASCLU